MPNGSVGPGAEASTDGNDSLRGGPGDDALYGQGGDDRLKGESGADLLFGGGGDDALDGGAGGDRLEGGLGSDRYQWLVGDGADLFIEAPTLDTSQRGDQLIVNGTDTNENITVSASGANVRVLFAGSDGISVSNFENISLAPGGGSDTVTLSNLGSLVQGVSIDLAQGAAAVIASPGELRAELGDRAVVLGGAAEIAQAVLDGAAHQERGGREHTVFESAQHGLHFSCSHF